jgi:hypothetical protein
LCTFYFTSQYSVADTAYLSFSQISTAWESIMCPVSRAGNRAFIG